MSKLALQDDDAGLAKFAARTIQLLTNRGPGVQWARLHGA
jgi:hypothetical protein